MQPHYRPFGGLRLTLSLAVVVSHSMPLEAPHSFLAAMGIGNIAVMGFFVLSGYIITEAAVTFYRDRPLAFLSNRFWRIVPPYWAALLVSVAVHYVLVRAGVFKPTDVGMPTSGMLATRNIIENFLVLFPRPQSLQVAVPEGFYGFVRFWWAIHIEVAYYLATFAAMALVLFTGRRRFFEIVLALFLAAHIVSEYLHPLRFNWELSFTPYFALGVCLYVANERGGSMATIGAVISYVLSVLHFSRYILGQVALHDVRMVDLLMPAHLTVVLLFMLLPVMILLLGKRKISGEGARVDRVLGDLTYPLYLNHFVILVIAYSLGWEFHGVTVLIVILSIVLSATLSSAVERPIRPIRNRIRGTKLILAG